MTMIKYAGVDLDIHPLLAKVWPFDFPYTEWPSYCGAGSGLGDKLISEYICGVRVSCCCADHDIRWSVAEDTWSAAIEANWVLYKNLVKFVWQNCDKTKYRRSKVEFKCFWWFLAVCWGARHYFSPLGGGEDGNVETEAKLSKLADAVKIYNDKAAIACQKQNK